MIGSAVFLTPSLWADDLAVAKEMKVPDTKKFNAAAEPLTYEDVHSVSPALEYYTKESLLGGLWKRPLRYSRRSRSMRDGRVRCLRCPSPRMGSNAESPINSPHRRRSKWKSAN